MASNHAKNRIRYLKRRAQGKKKEFDEIADQNTIESASMSTSAKIARPDDIAQAKQTEHLIQTALKAIDEEQRELVVLRDIQNLTYDEIQSITGLPEGTVKSRLHRARRALRKKLVELANPELGESTS